MSESKGTSDTYHEWNTGIVQNFVEIKQAFASKDGAAKMWMSNFMFLKIFGALFLVAMVIVNCTFHKMKPNLLTENPDRFAYESAVFALCSVIPFILVYAFRWDSKVSSNIPCGRMVLDMVIFFVIFFALNYLLELSGFYAVAFDYGREEPKPEATCTPAPDNVSEFGETFLWTSALYLGIGFLFCAFVIMVFVPLRVWDTCYHFRFDWSKTNTGAMGMFFIEMILFGAISAVAIYLMAANRGRLDPVNTSDEFGLIACKFCLLHIILQMSGFYNYWLRAEKPSDCAVSPSFTVQAKTLFAQTKNGIKGGMEASTSKNESYNLGSSWWTILLPMVVTMTSMYFLYQYRKRLAVEEEQKLKEERSKRTLLLTTPPSKSGDAEIKGASTDPKPVNWRVTLAPLAICVVLVVVLSFVKSKWFATH